MSTAPFSTSWIVRPRPYKQTRVRLFCFPYAGGGASAFQAWQPLLPEKIDLCLIQLPGREARMREQPYTYLPTLLDALVPALFPYLDQPFAFFGHSLGSLICFELARYLRAHQEPQPFHIFVSGCRAPHTPSTERPIHELPEAEFISELQRLNGTPASLLANRELMQLLMPMLRADFSLFETYTYKAEEPLACPISAFGGIHDSRATRQQIAPWSEHTTNTFTLQMFPGDHFFLNEGRKLLIERILRTSALSQYLNPLGALDGQP